MTAVRRTVDPRVRGPRLRVGGPYPPICLWEAWRVPVLALVIVGLALVVAWWLGVGLR